MKFLRFFLLVSTIVWRLPDLTAQEASPAEFLIPVNIPDSVYKNPAFSYGLNNHNSITGQLYYMDIWSYHIDYRINKITNLPEPPLKIAVGFFGFRHSLVTSANFYSVPRDTSRSPAIHSLLADVFVKARNYLEIPKSQAIKLIIFNLKKDTALLRVMTENNLVDPMTVRFLYLFWNPGQEPALPPQLSLKQSLTIDPDKPFQKFPPVIKTVAVVQKTNEAPVTKQPPKNDSVQKSGGDIFSVLPPEFIPEVQKMLTQNKIDLKGAVPRYAVSVNNDMVFMTWTNGKDTTIRVPIQTGEYHVKVKQAKNNRQEGMEDPEVSIIARRLLPKLKFYYNDTRLTYDTSRKVVYMPVAFAPEKINVEGLHCTGLVRTENNGENKGKLIIDSRLPRFRMKINVSDSARGISVSYFKIALDLNDTRTPVLIRTMSSGDSVSGLYYDPAIRYRVSSLVHPDYRNFKPITLPRVDSATDVSIKLRRRNSFDFFYVDLNGSNRIYLKNALRSLVSETAAHGKSFYMIVNYGSDPLTFNDTSSFNLFAKNILKFHENPLEPELMENKYKSTLDVPSVTDSTIFNAMFFLTQETYQQSGQIITEGLDRYLRFYAIKPEYHFYFDGKIPGNDVKASFFDISKKNN